MNTPLLPTSPLLAVYWLTSETTDTYPAPSLRNILCYTNADGSPQIGVVYLTGANFTGSPDNFQAPYLSFEPSLQNALSNGDVGLLQQAGIRVLLCVQGGGSSGSNSMGWGCMTDAQSQAFATWIQTNVIAAYGLDGIDIDDEFYTAPRTSQQLVNTVAWLRNALPNSLITKALWNDTTASGSQDFTTAATTSPLAGTSTTLAGLLSFGSTMGYGWSAQQMQQAAASYVQVGMSYDKLCLGVQPGPSQLNWMTSLDTTSTLATWVQQNSLLGMMMWSFSQDIAEFTTYPQYSVPYISTDDHQWQQKIIETWGGASDWVVDTANLKGIYYPEGSFCFNSSNIQLILTAELQNSKGKWVSATLDILNFDNANIDNSNGTFVKTETMLSPTDMTNIKTAITTAGLGDFVPVGSYFQTAKNIRVTLVAMCSPNSGKPVQSSLTLTTSSYATTNIANINGVLTLLT